MPSVLFGTLPGTVWVDHPSNPTCGLVLTPECQVLFGQPPDEETLTELFEQVGYFGSVTCDTPAWNPSVETYHQNSGIRNYQRIALKLKKDGLVVRPSLEPVVLVDYHDLPGLRYQNQDLVSDWINLVGDTVRGSLCVAALVVQDNTIVSCAAVDCIWGHRAEVGIKTMVGHRRRGYGLACVTALVGELFRQGFEEIGWHCVGTNRGSLRIAEAVGFSEPIAHEAYSPFPPIENDGDLDAKAWREYALFFEQRAQQNPNHHWQAAKCWAKAQDMDRSIHAIEQLVERDLLWFQDYWKDSPEFLPFAHHKTWLTLMAKIP